MTYTPLYTTIEQVGNRLRGRLLVSGAESPFTPTLVNPDLIEQVLQQVEARVNGQLRSVYKLPLVSSHAELSSAVEKLVVCDLTATHFVGDGQDEIGGFGRFMCEQGAGELAAILALQVPLEGEELITGNEPIVYRAYTRSALRKPGAAEGVSW